jgi:PLD-like domain
LHKRGQIVAESIIARWDVVRSLVQSARQDCTIFTPFYSFDGLSLLDASLRRTVALNFWTRLSLRDWAMGVSDPESLCKLLVKLDSTQRPTHLFRHRTLHAKAYFADSSSALVGSANLSKGGFETNVELMVQLSGTSAADTKKVLTTAASPGAVLVTTDELAHWISSNGKRIKQAQSQLKQGLRELEIAQRETDEELGERPTTEPTQVLLDEFVEWLANNRGLPAAPHLIKLHEDRVIQRQQGHVKQCFAGAFRFLQEYPTWIQELAQAAQNADGMVTPRGDLLRDWIKHLETHRNASNDLYSYSTLRRELPESRGGTHRGGGGAGTTLKRILPLVARFLSQRPQQG